MKCPQIEELLLPYLENELSPEEKAEVETHLKICPGCSIELENLKRVSHLLASFPDFEVSPVLQTRLYSLPASLESQTQPRLQFFKFFLKPSLQPVIATTCFFFLIVSFFLYHPDGRYLSRSLKEKIGLSLGRIEKTVVRIEELSGYLPLVKKSITDSLKNIIQIKSDLSEKT